MVAVVALGRKVLNPNFPIGAWALILFGLIFGLTLAGFGVKSLMLAHQSKSWPVAEGTITLSWMDAEDGEDGVARYRARVSYEYVVDLQSLYGSDDRTLTEEEAVEYVDKFPKGKSVDIYYDPDNPRKTTLVPGSTGGWGLVIGGLFLTLLSSSFVTFAIK